MNKQKEMRLNKITIQQIHSIPDKDKKEINKDAYNNNRLRATIVPVICGQ